MSETRQDWRAWARDLARDHDDIAMVVRFEPPGIPPDVHHVCLVMKDGRHAAFLAAGKGLEGVAWESVPGRARRDAILADPRLRLPGLRVTLNFCDARALLLTAAGGRERIGGEELIGAPYRLLHPRAEDRPALDAFYLLWGEPLGAAAATAPAGPGSRRG